MTDEFWQSYLGAIGSLSRLEGERQRRYEAADEEHLRAANRFATEQGAIERQWTQRAEQAARAKAAGDELMRRYRLAAAPEPEVTREGAGRALAEAERTITWCTQAARWVASYEERARQFAAVPATEAAPLAAPPPPPVPQPKAKAGCGVGAAAMLLAFVAAPTVLVLKLMGVI